MVCKINIDFFSNIFKGWANFLVNFVDWAKFSLTFIIDFVVELTFLGFLICFLNFRSVIFYGPFLFFFLSLFFGLKGQV